MRKFCEDWIWDYGVMVLVLCLEYRIGSDWIWSDRKEKGVWTDIETDVS